MRVVGLRDDRRQHAVDVEQHGRAGRVAPQIGGIAAGFAIIWALAWRRQEAAVAAIEERDGVRFYIEQTSPFKAIKLIRTPGFGGDFLRSPA